MTAQHIRRQETLAKFAGAIDLYKSGVTLAKIGEQFGVSRERIRQVLSAYGLTRADGGQSVVADAKRKEMAEKKKSNKFCERLGITKQEWIEAKSSGVLQSYRNQAHTAEVRGIQWLFTFKEWHKVWIDSGKLEQRGKYKDGYCMSRKNDQGPYASWNVEIKTNSENSREGFGRATSKKSVGVFNILKGRELSWLAKYGSTKIGWFKTEEEAIAARAKYLAESGITKFRTTVRRSSYLEGMAA